MMYELYSNLMYYRIAIFEDSSKTLTAFIHTHASVNSLLNIQEGRPILWLLFKATIIARKIRSGRTFAETKVAAICKNKEFWLLDII